MTDKAKLGFIPGIVLYFKDKNCLSYKLFPQAGYFTLNLYPKNQEAYQALCKITNKERNFYISRLDDEFPLYTWEDLETLKEYQFSLVLSGPHSLLAKLALAGHSLDTINPIFEKLKSIFSDISVALVAANQDSFIQEVIKIKTNKGYLELDLKDRIDVIKEGKVLKKVNVEELERPFHGFVKILVLHRKGKYYKADLSLEGENGTYPIGRRLEKFSNLKLGNVFAKANKLYQYLAVKNNYRFFLVITPLWLEKSIKAYKIYA
jgi:hypothetical protein